MAASKARRVSTSGRKSLREGLTTLYKAKMKEDVTVRDWDFTEHVLPAGFEYEVLLEITCADGLHVRLKTPGITAPTWLHKNLILPTT